MKINPSPSRYLLLSRLLLGGVGLVPLVSPAQSTPPGAVAPNVMFLVDNSRAMQEFSVYLPEDNYPSTPPSSSQPGELGYNDPQYGHFINTGCSDPWLVAAMSWFDKSSADPSRNGSIPFDTDPNLRTPFFDPNLLYQSRGRRVSWEGNNEERPASMGADFRTVSGLASVDGACRQIWNSSSAYQRKAVHAECMQCLTSKGWWRGPITPPGTSSSQGFLGPPQLPTEPPLPPEARRKWIVSGGVLNLRPPRFVVARRVLKDILQTANGVRMGVATFGAERGWFDPVSVLSDIRPLSCSASVLPFDEAQLERTALINAVNNVRFANSSRPTGEALFSLGGYFSSQRTDNRWESWFAQPLGNPNWGWPGQPKGGTMDSSYSPSVPGRGYGMSSDEWLKGEYTDPSGIRTPGQRWEWGGDKRSICFDNQVNAVVVVTVGTPLWDDNTVPITKMMSLLIAQNARHESPGQELVTFNPVDPRVQPNAYPGGINYCDRFNDGWGRPGTVTDCDYTDFNWPTGLLEGNKNFMDDTSFFLAHMDLRGDLSGTQSLRTLVIGYNASQPMLQSIALAGRGWFYRADAPAQLSAALNDALERIRGATP